MNLSLLLPTPLQYFRSLVQSDDGFPLLEAAISLAQDDYPELDVQQVLGEVDLLLSQLKRRLPADATGLHKLRSLNQFLYRDLGFACNFNHYDDPDNSYLNKVLRNRRGIPISLAVLWLELAQGLGLKARGVSFPGHFLVKVKLLEGQVILDPLSGQSLSHEQLSERLEPYRQPAGGGPEFDSSLGVYLRAAAPRDIIQRMLANLKIIHQTQDDESRLLAVQDRLDVLLAGPVKAR